MTTFLKLGGSVLTEKRANRAARMETIRRIAGEIAESLRQQPELRLLLGHGSGSFGHAAAARHGTHLGARTAQDWIGFAKVWLAARQLNTIVIHTLVESGLPAVSFAPSASAQSEDGRLVSMATGPIEQALDAGLLPVVYGDVVFDKRLGSSIASTEELFALLATTIKPTRLLLAGRAEGVYRTDREPPELLAEITPDVRAKLNFESPSGDDVTGGMASKVDVCLDLAAANPEMEILIFSADKPNQLQRVLLGERSGTRIRT